MNSYIIAFVIYCLFLSTVTLIAFCILRKQEKPIKKMLNADFNNAYIVNFIDALYDEIISVERDLTNNAHKKILPDAFADIILVHDSINIENICGFVNSIEISERNNTDDSCCDEILNNIGEIPRELLSLLDKKRLLIGMILCHQVNIYNAKELATDELKAVKRLKKIMPFKLLRVKICKLFVVFLKSIITSASVVDNLNAETYFNKYEKTKTIIKTTKTHSYANHETLSYA